MAEFDRTAHWENIYQTRSLESVSWYQPMPSISLEFIEATQKPKTAKIIDIGGGDSFLADYLLEAGYTDITVLDISASAIARAKKRLGEKANRIKWIVSDIIDFKPKETYDIWHDRAAFHFLTVTAEISNYHVALNKSLKSGGTFIVGTFAENGPTKCSGLEIKQYSTSSLIALFVDSFSVLKCTDIGHTTPGGSIQQFAFCSFLKK